MDKETIIKGCEYWVNNHKDENFLLTYSSVVELLDVLKGQEDRQSMITTREKVIKGLEFTKAMITFNPLTGEDIEPEDLNEDNKTTYDACVGAIALLEEQEKSIPISWLTEKLEGHPELPYAVTDGIINVLELWEGCEVR